MKNWILISFFLLFTTYFAVGQDRYFKSHELGFTLGTQYYLGELNHQHYYKPKLGLGGNYRMNFNRRLGLNFGAYFGVVEGADSNSTNAIEVNRNLHFRSRIQELSAILEINFFDYQINNRKYPYTPYLFIGVAGVFMNPQAQNQNGEWVDLKGIGTEGQNMGGASPYNLFNFAVPMGVGFRCNIAAGFAVSVYAGFRKTFTDYMDDVGGTYANPNDFEPQDAYFVDRSFERRFNDNSNEGLERGNPNTLDWYQITGVMLSFKINARKTICPAWYN